jgi:8-oxo-dGTP diphosphatase
MTDKRRVDSELADAAQFSLIEPQLEIRFDSVTSVCVLAFTKSANHLIAVLLPRGLDIPGGHVTTYDESIEATARREAMEEAAISITAPILIGYLESNALIDSIGITHIAMVAAMVEELLPFNDRYDAIERQILSPSDFLREYRGDKMLMQELINRAQSALAL